MYRPYNYVHDAGTYQSSPPGRFEDNDSESNDRNGRRSQPTTNHGRTEAIQFLGLVNYDVHVMMICMVHAVTYVRMSSRIYACMAILVITRNNESEGRPALRLSWQGTNKENRREGDCRIQKQTKGKETKAGRTGRTPKQNEAKVIA